MRESEGTHGATVGIALEEGSLVEENADYIVPEAEILAEASDCIALAGKGLVAEGAERIVLGVKDLVGEGSD